MTDTDVTVETAATEVQEESFEKQYEEEVARLEKAAQNREAAAQRIAQKAQPVAEESDDIAERVAAKLFPRLQVQNESALLEAKLEKRSEDQNLQRLIRHHFEHTINSSAGNVDERLDLAEAAARKNSILKTSSELKVALRNRQQIQNGSQGNSTDGKRVEDANFSEAQLADLTALAHRLKAKDVNQFIENARKNMQKAAGR